MGRARRARKIAAAAAYGGGLGFAGVGAAGLVGYWTIKAEARHARRRIGKPFETFPEASDLYGVGVGDPIDLIVLGDSLAAGVGAESRYETIGGILAVGVAALAGRPLRLTNVAVSGAEASWLDAQVTRALTAVPAPHCAVISVGGNDVTHRIDRAISVRHLEHAVRRLREAHCEVVVGTCPDLGTIEPLAQPLRLLVRHWARDMAAAQTVAVVEAGGRTVSLGDLLGPHFAAMPEEMFSADRFHPSPAGYARAAAALLPSVALALDLWPLDPDDASPDRLRGEGLASIADAATRAVRMPGSEVSGADVAGRERGPSGRWAMVRRWGRRAATPDGGDPDEVDDD
ncbi:MAG: SGNH/GDSL hydrolase family protein [Austwickia sp.]|jgi:lysophospholipase L1-like esterase|nr:MAG: SGNH/GDSL hydrolase family protein [Austwickia sp.]